MEDFIREHCKFYGQSFDEMIQQYNLNKITRSYIIDYIIKYKIENNKDNIYKEDIPNICSKYFEQNISQEKFMEHVMKYIKSNKIDINNLTIEDSFYTSYLQFYYISTFLEHETVDIKIALKD